MPRKPRNLQMVITLLIVLGLAGMFIETFGFFAERKMDKEHEQLMEQFEHTFFGTDSIRFKERSLISKKEIIDYECYVNPRYQVLFDEAMMYADVKQVSTLTSRERRAAYEAQAEMFEWLSKTDTTETREQTLEIERIKLSLMKLYADGEDDVAAVNITQRLKEVNDSLHRFEFQSPGYEYIILCVGEDDSRWQITMVTPKDDTRKMHIIGGKQL